MSEHDFIVTTRELVAGTYRVQAESAQDAIHKFGHIKGQGLIRWSGVEQVEYEAYQVSVKDVEQA